LLRKAGGWAPEVGQEERYSRVAAFCLSRVKCVDGFGESVMMQRELPALVVEVELGEGRVTDPWSVRSSSSLVLRNLSMRMSCSMSSSLAICPGGIKFNPDRHSRCDRSTERPRHCHYPRAGLRRWQLHEHRRAAGTVHEGGETSFESVVAREPFDGSAKTIWQCYFWFPAKGLTRTIGANEARTQIANSCLAILTL
jgi:hypothetical protein